MLILSLLVAALTAHCYLVGALVCSRDRTLQRLEMVDRAVVHFWVGLVAVALLQQIIALLLPVTLAVSLGSAVLLVSVALLQRAVREEIGRVRARLSPGVLCGAGVLLASLAYVHTYPIGYYDTREYHAQAVFWAARFGAVPGLALVQARLGFTSTWFPFLAPFNPDPAAARLLSLGACLVTFVAVLQTCLCTARMVNGEGTRADRFWIASFLLLLPLVAFQVDSASPDLPASFLVLVVACLFLQPAHPAEAEPVGTGLLSGWAPLLLACGAAALKLSVIWLPVVAGVFVTLRHGFGARRLAVGLVMGALLLAPGITTSVVTSGAPLFPAPLFLTRLPWALTRLEVTWVADAIRAWAYWDGPVPKADGTFLDFAARWARDARFPFLLAAAVITTPVLLRARHRRVPGTPWVLAAAWGGIAFWLYSAPYPRFGSAAVVLTPGLLLALLAEQQPATRLHGVTASLAPVLLVASERLARTRLHWLGGWVYCLGAGTLFLLVSGRRLEGGEARESHDHVKSRRAGWIMAAAGALTVLVLIPVQLPTRSRLLAPPALEQANTWQEKTVHDFTYHLVTGECLATPLPCAQAWVDPERYGVRLRDPARGLAAGFVRSIPNTR